MRVSAPRYRFMMLRRAAADAPITPDIITTATHAAALRRDSAPRYYIEFRAPCSMMRYAMF